MLLSHDVNVHFKEMPSSSPTSAQAFHHWLMAEAQGARKTLEAAQMKVCNKMETLVKIVVLLTREAE